MKLFERIKKLGRKKCLAIVLGGGGARGAFQAGALQAMQEAGIQPDLLVGTSIGAVNAAFLAINGFSAEGVQQLKEVWKDAETADLLPTNYLWLTVRSMFGRDVINPVQRMRDFFIKHGLPPELNFSELNPTRLIAISSDLNSGRIVTHGLDPNERVLEAVLASAALPPWVSPIQQDDRYLIDGGLLSSLPIEPAMRAGATEIIAVDLSIQVKPEFISSGFGPFFERLLIATEQRQVELEIALAEARHVPITYIRLDWPSFLPPWNFKFTQELIDLGYQATLKQLESR